MQTAFSDSLTMMLREAFRRLLLSRVPLLTSCFEPDTNSPVEFAPANWSGPPFRIEFRGDTITVYPLCSFGLDYIFTVSANETYVNLDVCLGKLVEDIADFVEGRTVIGIARRKVLLWKAGWDVRFVSKSDADQLSRSGASIIAWPSDNA